MEQQKTTLSSEVLARLAAVRADQPKPKRDYGYKEYLRGVAKEIQQNGIAEPKFYDTDPNFFKGNEPTDFKERLLAGVPSLQIPSDKAEVQSQYAVEAFRDKCRGTVVFDEKIEQFRYYDFGKWHDLDRRRMGILLREFAVELGCSYYTIGSAKGIEGLLKQAEYELITTFDSKRGLLNFPNGTLELESMVFRSHDKEDHLTWQLGYNYDPQAKCPKWESVLKDWVADDVAVVLQELFGYTFMDSRHEKLGLCVGTGRNGKSVCLDAFSEAIGRHNVANFSLAQVTDEVGVCRASMEGKLLNISMDNNQKIADAATFKSYISGEALSIKKLYHQPYTSNNYPKTILAMNALPITEDFSDGFYRRLLIIPFDTQIPISQMDTDLRSKLKSECAGILNWSIAGAVRLRANERFSKSPTINKMLEEYRRESDVVACYVEEHQIIATKETKMLLSISYSLFSEWCRKCGYSTMGIRTYSKRLRGLKFRVEKQSGSAYVWMAEAEIADLSADEIPY